VQKLQRRAQDVSASESTPSDKPQANSLRQLENTKLPRCSETSLANADPWGSPSGSPMAALGASKW